jgi:hypothetical protein
VGATVTITASPVALEYIAGEGGFATATAVWVIAGALLLVKSQWRGPVRDAAPAARDRVLLDA